MLHKLFKDFSPSVSQLSPNPIPMALLDAFCSFISVIYFPYSLLHTLPIICQDNSLSVGVDQTQPPVLLHTRSKQNCSVQFLPPAAPARPCPLPFLLSLHKVGKCFLTALLLPKCHSACFSLLSGVSHARGLVLISWLQRRV